MSNSNRNRDQSRDRHITDDQKVIILQKEQRVYDVNQLKQQLEAWKFILVSVNNLADWERQYDPLTIIAINTFIFGFIKLYDPSILTTVSLIGLLVLLCEYAVPMLTSYLFKQSDWDTTADLKYTRICERLSNLYEHVISSKNKLEKIRKEKQSLYFILMFFFLICCAYIGQCIDNVLLTYLAVSAMTLIPGARKHELAQKMKLKVKELLGGKLNGSMFDKKK